MKFKIPNTITNANAKLPDMNNMDIDRKKMGIIPGSEIGYPLLILEQTFMQLHYNKMVITPETVILPFLLGTCTYGTDRFIDAFLSQTDEEICDTEGKCYKVDKLDKLDYLYKYILDNKVKVFSELSVFYLITFSLFNQSGYNEFTYILLLCSTYSQYKRYIGMYKSVYIGVLWSIASIIIPCVLYEHNYNILYDPCSYMPICFNIIGTSNFLDIKDIDEDKADNVETIPVKYGIKTAKLYSLIALIISSITLSLSPHYVDNPQSVWFEVQNAIWCLVICVVY